MAFMDAYMGGVAELLGETLPDRVFARYEWTDIEHGRTFRRDDTIVIQDDLLPSQHELVHAVHQVLWPQSRPFLHEGLAVLLDSAGVISAPWPEGASLEALLEADASAEVDYFQAWFVVSQIVRDHGFEGLRDLWHAVPREATADEVEQAYAELFGRPMASLFEPEVWFPGEPFEMEVPRYSCYLSVCVGDATQWEGDSWSGEAVSGCEDDPNAVGPTPESFLAPVWRPYVLETGENTLEISTSVGVGAFVRPCGLRCGMDAFPFTGTSSGDTIQVGGSWLSARVRIDVGRELDELPTEDAGSVTIERLGP